MEFILFPVLVPPVLLSLLLLYLAVKGRSGPRGKRALYAALFVPPVLYFSISVQPPVKGAVLNALTGKPVEDVNITRFLTGTANVINPGGASSKDLRTETRETGRHGEYSFGWLFYAHFPFYYSIGSHYTDITAGGHNAALLPYTNFGELQRKNGGQTPPAAKEEAEFNLARPFNNSFAVTADNKTYFEAKANLYGYSPCKFAAGRIAAKPQTINFFLFPKVKNLADCDPALNADLAEICRRANVEELAFGADEPGLCALVPAAAEACLQNFVRAGKNSRACNYFPDKAAAEECRRSLAGNKTSCEALEGALWGTWPGEAKPRCHVKRDLLANCDYYKLPECSRENRN